MFILEAIQNGDYNRKLKRMGVVDESEIVETTIGWRRDPINKEDGQTPVRGGNGEQEFQTIIRRGSKKD